MSFEPRDYLRHILVEVEYLLDHSQNLTYASYWRSGEEPARGVPGIAPRS